MTTIAFDGHTLAADSLCCEYFGLKSTNVKIFERPDFLVGFSGDVGLAHAWLRSVDSKELSLDEVLRRGIPDWRREEDNLHIMLIDRFGTIYTACSGVFVLARDRHYHAIGSGRDFALAAMRVGADAKRAVEIAIEFDNNSGGEVQALIVKK